jgi:hypothetical protein
MVDHIARAAERVGHQLTGGDVQLPRPLVVFLGAERASQFRRRKQIDETLGRFLQRDGRVTQREGDLVAGGWVLAGPCEARPGFFAILYVGYEVF